MSYADEEMAVQQRLKDAWGTTTPIKYGDVAWQEPSGIPWIAVFVQNAEANQIDIRQDHPRARYPGRIVVQVFGPQAASFNQRTLKLYADQLAAIFQRQQFSAGDSGVLHTGIATVASVPAVGGWTQVNVTVPFYRDQAV